MLKTKTRAPVPKRDEKPVMGLSSNKNFITTNAVEVILAKPKKVPQEEFVWTSRPGYGSVPVYLRRNKAKIREEREQLETYMRLRHEPVSGNCRASAVAGHASTPCLQRELRSGGWRLHQHPFADKPPVTVAV
jgi:hypothetical protein